MVMVVPAAVRRWNKEHLHKWSRIMTSFMAAGMASFMAAGWLLFLLEHNLSALLVVAPQSRVIISVKQAKFLGCSSC
jgi:hypothetical protein